MIDWKAFAVCLFAIAASYLIISLPAADAATVTITSGQTYQTVSYNPEAEISKQVTIDSATGAVSIRVSNSSPTSIIDTVYIYKCLERSPSDCISNVQPEQSTGGADISYPWSAISVQPGGTRANIMLLVKSVNATRTRWLSFWSSASRGAQYSIYDFDLASPGQAISIAATGPGYLDMIRSYILINGMLPFNTNWISSIAVSGFSGLHRIDSTAPPAATAAARQDALSITSVPNNGLTFLFPNQASEVFNGLAVASSPNYVCGDNVCSSTLGETQSNCCMDCIPPSDYYCDSANGRQLLSSIGLVPASAGTITVSNCNTANTFQLGFRVTNMPTGATLQSASYSVGGSASQMAACTNAAGSDVFMCAITTPVVPGCSGNSHTWTPNSMTFTMRFLNASRPITYVLPAVPFPNVVVGSWTCGSSGCESGLGETSANCCYDCPCAAGQYCDPGATPAPGTCRAPPSNSNLQVVSADPSRFFTHNAASGNTVRYNMQISSAPTAITAATAACSVDSCLKDGTPCAATCSVSSCNQVTSVVAGIYNSTCNIVLQISNYDAASGYVLTPSISRTLTFSNATRSDSVTVSSSALPATFGPHSAGDGNCDADETPASVCFDCSCPPDQYCRSAVTTAFTAGDVCRPLADTSIDPAATPLSFMGTEVAHNVSISSLTAALVPGLSAAGACMFNNGQASPPECRMLCWTHLNDAGDKNNVTCNLTVPAMDYRTSTFFDPASDKIILPNNMYNITLSFNNGSHTSSRTQSFTLGELGVTVVPRCGNGYCDTLLGETSANCCSDCSCATGFYCPAVGGGCRATNEVFLAINETKPNPIRCTIQQYKGDCMFIETVSLTALIVRQPRNAQLETAWYTNSTGGTSEIVCTDYVQGTDTQDAAYQCSFIPDNIRNPGVGERKVWGNISIQVAYPEGGAMRQLNVSSWINITVKQEKSDYVKSCDRQIKDIEKQEKDLKTQQTIMMAILGAIAAATAGFCICCAIPTCTNNFVCKACFWGICITICVTGIILPMLLSVMDKIKQLKEQKKAICNANNAADMAAANKDSFNLAGILIGALLGIACIICLMKAMGPNGAGAGSASKASGAPAAMPGASGTPAITNPVYQGPLRTGPAIITA